LRDLTPRDLDAMSELKDFYCRNCRTPTAQTDGLRIFVNGKEFPLNPTRIKFPCPLCGAPVEWFAAQRKNGLRKPQNMLS
jgi:hypothetical protein